MSWSVDYNHSLGIIEEVLSGLVTAADLRESVSRRIALEKKTGSTKILVDAAEIDLDATAFDVFDFPNKQYADQGANRQNQMALVMPTYSRARETAELFVIACKNRGWLVQGFAERQAAIDWLSSNKASDIVDAGKV